MTTTLRCCNPLPWLVLLLVLLGGTRPALASHLLGGEMTYRYLGATGPTAAPYRYEVTTSVYVACSNANTSLSLEMTIFNKTTGALISLTSANLGSPNATLSTAYAGGLRLAQSSIGTCTTISVPVGCTITGASQPYQLQKFVGIVCLPASSAGYYVLTAPGGSRNAGINNLGGNSSSGYSLGLYTTLAPPSIPNSSPVFTGDAVGLICSGDTTVVLNNAVDADGDRLAYAFGQPYSGATGTTVFNSPLPYVPYTTAGGYSATTPLGSGAGYSAQINASTGITKYLGGPLVGNRYGIAVDVTEYRVINGVEVALGTTRRDIQLLVGQCPPTAPPVLPTVAAMPRTYTIEAGSTLSIPITGTQPAAHPLTLTATSALLDGSSGYDATFAGNAGTLTYAGSPVGAYTVTGTTGGAVAGTFAFTPTCAQARATPYDVTLVLRDVGCAGKLASDVLRILVVQPTGPTTIAGNLAVCGLNTTQTYTAAGGTAPIVSWTVTGGTIVGSATANPVTVSWPTAGTGTVKAQGITQYGCLVNAVTQNVTVTPTPVLTATGNLTICRGSSTTLTVAGGTPPYNLTGGTTPIAGAGPFVLSPTQTTTYTISAVVLPASGCPPTGQVTVTVVPRPVASAGAAVSICPGGTAQLGATPVAGTAYTWSPATGLSSSTVANPTVTLANATGAPITQTYTLTATNTGSGCQVSSTVVVTVAPPPPANVGAAVAFCSGGSAQLGAAAVAGSTYSWSPATGLNSPNVANPTVTLTNATGAPITQTYTLMVSAAGGCAATGTVVVTVNPPPVANAGAAVALCSGGSAQLGAAAVGGSTYSWSPATGLSSSTVANPTITLANTTSAATTQTYALTVTNAGGCAATSTVVVTVNPLPVANAGAAVVLCSGGSAQLGAAPVAGYSYSWSPATGLNSPNVANPTVTLTNATGAPITQTYTLTVTNATGCVRTASVAVTVSPLPVAVPGAAITSCSGSAGQLGAAPVAGYSYSWSPATGLNSPNVANPTVTLTNATGVPITQTYTLTVTNASGCPGASTGTVAVVVLPTVMPGAIGADQTVCVGTVPALLTSPAAAAGGAGTYGYQWEASPDNVTWAALPNATGLTYAPGPVATTTYFRRRVAAGTCGTAYSNVVRVQTQPLLVPTVALPVPPAQCAGSALAFAPIPANAGAAPTYQWFVNGVAIGTGPTFTSTTLADGDLVRVELTPTAGFCASGGATATARVSLTPVPTPTATIVLQTALPVCAGGSLTFGLDQTATIGPNPQYQWQVDGINVAGATRPTFTSATLRDGQAVTLALRTTNACGQPATAISAAVRATISQPVQVSAGPDKTITEGESVVLEGTAGGPYPVSWSPAQTLTFEGGNRLRPVATPLATTTYALSAGAGYCGGPSLVTVTVLPRVRIPNAFSPNGDNNDDTWQIDNIEAYPSSRVIVFNRWGSKIFETTNYTRGSEWRGTVNGQPVPFGTYYYVITLGNGKSFTGPITVLN